MFFPTIFTNLCKRAVLQTSFMNGVEQVHGGIFHKILQNENLTHKKKINIKFNNNY